MPCRGLKQLATVPSFSPHSLLQCCHELRQSIRVLDLCPPKNSPPVEVILGLFLFAIRINGQQFDWSAFFRAVLALSGILLSADLSVQPTISVVASARTGIRNRTI